MLHRVGRWRQIDPDAASLLPAVLDFLLTIGIGASGVVRAAPFMSASWARSVPSDSRHTKSSVGCTWQVRCLSVPSMYACRP